MKKIIVTIPLEGISLGKRQTKVEAEGFTGSGCKTATDALLKAIGSVQDDTLKSEYYAANDEITQTVES